MPPMMKIMAMRSASAVLIRREGRGRLRVRSIRSSYGHSWYWLNAEAPEASMKIPAMGISADKERCAGLRMKAVNAVNVTASETGNRVRAKTTRSPEVCKWRGVNSGCDERRNYLMVLR